MDDVVVDERRDDVGRQAPSSRWPVAAASRIRVRVVNDDDGDSGDGGDAPPSSSPWCRLFLDPSTGGIDLVPTKADGGDGDDDDGGGGGSGQRAIYDSSNDAGVQDEPYYKSYVADAAAVGRNSAKAKRVVVDSFHPDDVIGANLSLEYDAKNPNTFHGMRSYATAKFRIYCYPKKKEKNGRRGRREARHGHYVIDPRCCMDFADARSIIRSVREIAGLDDDNNSKKKRRPMKCLVVLNPFSGGGNKSSKTGATYVYENMLRPMFEEAGIDHDALVTRRAGHARERMMANKTTNSAKQQSSANEGAGATTTKIDGDSRKGAILNGDAGDDAGTTDSECRDVSEYDAIIAMGGDGILFEIFQGIRDRQDRDSIMSNTKFGVVPCGTCNGLAKSLLHWSGDEYDVLESIFRICRGRTSLLDVADYRVLPPPLPSSSSSSEGGEESGGGEVKSENEEGKSYASFLSFAWGLIADCDFESECLRWMGPMRVDVWAVYRGVLFTRRYRARFSYLPPSKDGGAPPARAPQVIMPERGKPLPEGWESIEDEFRVFWVCNTSHASFDMFTCPMAKMNDGLFHVLIVRSSCSRLRLIDMLLKLDAGRHIDCKDLEVIDCVAYQIEPLTDVSYNVLDGELIKNGTVQARFRSNGAQFFVGKV